MTFNEDRFHRDIHKIAEARARTLGQPGTKPANAKTEWITWTGATKSHKIIYDHQYGEPNETICGLLIDRKKSKKLVDAGFLPKCDKCLANNRPIIKRTIREVIVFDDGVEF